MNSKGPLKLKLKLGSSTPEPQSPAAPKMNEDAKYEEEWNTDLQADARVDNNGESNLTQESIGDEAAREKHKKAKKKKKKKDKDKEKEKHKHKHHRDRLECDEDEPPNKRHASEPPSKEALDAFKDLLQHLLHTMKKKDAQHFFTFPVTDAIAPGYSSIINNPMDFSQMTRKVLEGQYPDLKSVQSDLTLISNNCMTYNQPETVYYKAAKKLIQNTEKLLNPQRIALLKKELPNIIHITKEQLDFDINSIYVDEEDTKIRFSDTENSQDMLSSLKYESKQDEMSAEQILEQAQRASREAAEKLTLKKPVSTLAFLRQRKDGTTTLNFLAGCEGNNGQREKPVTLGMLTGKLPQGSSSLTNYRDDKRSMAKPVKPLYYGAFSSFCPSYDSTFANLTKEESEMVYSTYGNETAVQYAESICDYSRDCDMAMHLVDQLLNLLTHEQHSKTKAFLVDKRDIQQDDQKISNILNVSQNELVKEECKTDYKSLNSLSDLGIDTTFLKTFENLEEKDRKIVQKLDETNILIETLAKEQKDRLSKPLPANLNNVPLPSHTELKLAEKVQESLTFMVKQVKPGDIAPVSLVRRAMGISANPISNDSSDDKQATSEKSFMDMNSESFTDKVPESETDSKLKEILQS